MRKDQKHFLDMVIIILFIYLLLFFFFEFYVMEKHFKAIIDKVPRKTLALEYNQFK